MGHRRRLLRGPGRPAGPRQDHDDHHSFLHDLHGSERAFHRRLGLQYLPLPVRPRRGRPVRNRRGAGGGGGAAARAVLRPGDGAGVIGRGQHDGGADWNRARPDGDVGLHHRRMALHVPCRRGAGAAGSGGLQEAEGTGTVAQGARGKEEAGVLRRTVFRSALEEEFDCRFPAGFRGNRRAVGYRVFQLRPVPSVLENTFRAQGLTGAALAGKTTTWIGVTSLLQNLGAFFGVYAFTYLTNYTGRVKAFAISFVAAMGMTAYTFWNLRQISDIFWMIPLMGFAQLSLFGGYAIYFAELFPTRLRSTGTSFCYNVGRFAAAAGPFTLGYLTSDVFGGKPEPMRYAGVAMCLVFLVGLAALPFAPETQGKPLPE